MKVKRLEISHIIARFGKQFVEQCNPNPYQLRVLNALTQCRTSELGGHKQVCDGCGQIRFSYNSCHNRHCPKCQASKQALWVEDLLETTLPVKHFHMVFTVPHELYDICLADSAAFYSCLFSCVWDTLQRFGYSHFGVETGAVCVLHTWGQNLSLHPHIHCIVPAAGQTCAGHQEHIGHGGKYLYPVRQLSTVFRAKFLQAIKKSLASKKVLDKYQKPITIAWNNPWVVFCEPSLAKPEHVIKYLGQYTHRVAITNQRLLGIDPNGVRFMHKDYSDNAKLKPIALSGVEFLRRFCLHILPSRFVKIRRYGIYSARHRALINKQNPVKPLKTKTSTRDRLLVITGFDIHRCPVCKKGTIRSIEELPKIRSPGSLYAILATPVTL